MEYPKKLNYVKSTQLTSKLDSIICEFNLTGFEQHRKRYQQHQANYPLTKMLDTRLTELIKEHQLPAYLSSLVFGDDVMGKTQQVIHLLIKYINYYHQVFSCFCDRSEFGNPSAAVDMFTALTSEHGRMISEIDLCRVALQHSSLAAEESIEGYYLRLLRSVLDSYRDKIWANASSVKEHKEGILDLKQLRFDNYFTVEMSHVILNLLVQRIDDVSSRVDGKELMKAYIPDLVYLTEQIDLSQFPADRQQIIARLLS